MNKVLLRSGPLTGLGKISATLLNFRFNGISNVISCCLLFVCGLGDVTKVIVLLESVLKQNRFVT